MTSTVANQILKSILVGIISMLSIYRMFQNIIITLVSFLINPLRREPSQMSFLLCAIIFEVYEQICRNSWYFRGNATQFQFIDISGTWLKGDYVDLYGIFGDESFHVYVNLDVVVEYILIWQMISLVICEMTSHLLRLCGIYFCWDW